MGGTPYGRTKLCKFAFAVSLEARCFALERAIKQGYVSTLDIRYEFPEYSPTSARDVLYVLARYGILEKGPRTFDVQGKFVQQNYILSKSGRAGLLELHQLTSHLLAELGETLS